MADSTSNPIRSQGVLWDSYDWIKAYKNRVKDNQKNPGTWTSVWKKDLDNSDQYGDYESVGTVASSYTKDKGNYKVLLRRKTSKAEPTKATFNSKVVEDALAAAEPYTTAYSKATRPSYDASESDPYKAAASYAKTGRDYVSAVGDLYGANARLGAAETGASLKYALDSLQGAPADVANWEDIYGKLKKDVASVKFS